MIDIHCHLLYGVDDGPKTFAESRDMLREAKAQGISHIILTPHYRHGMFPYDKERILRHFKKVREYAGRIGVEVCLGCEYHVNSKCIQYLDTGRCLTLGGSTYTLTEYSYETEYSYIRNMTRELTHHGYTPVIAHVERYRCMTEDPGRAEELQTLGALVQVNADAVLGLEGRKTKQYCRYLLKHGLADIVSSDSHGMDRRACHMEKCQTYVTRKFGAETARNVFERNPGKILEEACRADGF